MDKKHNDIAVIIPAHNEESSIRDIVEPILNFTDKIIVIDDGSTDRTIQRIHDLPITLLQNLKNKGKGLSLWRGFQHAQQWDVHATICLDADAQHDPHDIPRFIEAMHEFPNRIIIGARTENKANAPRSRYRANLVADFFISWAVGYRVVDTQSGYRLYPINFLRDCVKHPRFQHFGFESELIIQASRRGYHPASIPIRSTYPKNLRPSHYRPILDTLRISWLITLKIVGRGFCVPNLLRMLFKKPSK